MPTKINSSPSQHRRLRVIVVVVPPLVRVGQDDPVLRGGVPARPRPEEGVGAAAVVAEPADEERGAVQREQVAGDAVEAVGEGAQAEAAAVRA